MAQTIAHEGIIPCSSIDLKDPGLEWDRGGFAEELVAFSDLNARPIVLHSEHRPLSMPGKRQLHMIARLGGIVC